MFRSKDDQQESFLNSIQFEQLVERLCMQIEDSCHKTPDPEMACVVYLAKMDKKAQEYGWPSAKVMHEGIRQALGILPKHISERVEVEEV